MVGHALGTSHPTLPEFLLPDNHEAADTQLCEACHELATLNQAAQDADLRFEAQDHTYFFKGKLMSTSVPKQQLALLVIGSYLTLL